MADLSVRAKIISDIVLIHNRTRRVERRLQNEDYGESELDKPFKYPDFYNAEIIDMGNFRMEVLKRNNAAIDEWAILQLHGGGYLSPFRNPYRTLAGLYSEAARGAMVVSVDYRVAPENPYPAAVDDALAAYLWILQAGYLPEKVIFGGDSAGGGLAMALCHRLKRLGIALPAGIVAMSPWTDLTTSLPSYKDKFDVDPVFGNSRSEVIFDNPYPGEENPKNPEISPLYGDFEGFPPMLIQVGSEEMLYSDSEAVAAKAKEAGVKVKFSVYEGMFHVFQLSAMLMPESKKAWFEVRRFMDEITGQGSSEGETDEMSETEESGDEG